ncbi:MAG: alpha/beta hydrolase [Candidatus Sericytochromatia bacterium]
MAEKKPLGVLILHGFTGSLDSVRGLVPTVEGLGLPYRMPVLRGHGTRYEDMHGTTAKDWYEDAEAALTDLLQEVEKAVVVGLSMGGLVTLNLAIAHERDLAGIILVAPALRFADPLTALTPILARLFPYWDAPNSFSDPECAKACTNYPKFATSAFASLREYGIATERRLSEVRVPTLVLHSHKDTVASPVSAKIIMERIASPEKNLVWFDRTGHEMLQDCEAEAVFRVIGEEIEARLSKPIAS